MDKQVNGNPDLYLKIGWTLAIHGKTEEELGATVAKISPGKLGLELSRPTLKFPFRAGEKVGIRYWDKGTVVYSWDAEVVDTSDLEKQRVEVCIGRKVVVQRRTSCRVCLPIPISFTVIGAADTQLISKKVLKGTTQNISIGGLAFETRLPLKVGDQLETNLHLSPSLHIDTGGWVVRSQSIQGLERDRQLIALMFHQMEEEEQDRLSNFLAQ
jgi:c-di-GMP-binding flagellar brake protein YcgR